jgi:hypothetical protein
MDDSFNENINYISDIKLELKNKIGYVAVFFFLTVIYGTNEYPGPYS